MKKVIFFFLFVFLILWITNAQDLKIPLWSGKAPYSLPCENTEYTDSTDGIIRTRNIKNATLSFYFSDKTINCTSILICPGGGYSILAVGHEGEDIAKWLNSFGVTGIVLKYRLPDTSFVTNKQLVPVTDALEAVRLVRSKARHLGFDPGKIGIMGFSAGGHVASTVLTHYKKETVTNYPKVSARPDFGILVYPVISMTESITHNGSRNNLLGPYPEVTTIRYFSGEENVDNQTPPVFIVHTEDNQAVKIENSINFFEALRKKGVPAELHIYPYGGHGFGLAKGKPGISHWPELCKNWLKNVINTEP